MGTGLDNKTTSSKIWIALLAATAAGGSSTLSSHLALADQRGPGKPIANPFTTQYANPVDDPQNSNMVLRTKKGDRSIEIELPRVDQGMTDFVIPVSPHFKDGTGRSPASISQQDGLVDETYRDRRASYTDREIISGLPTGAPEDADRRRLIEDGLGLAPSANSLPDHASNTSYLAGLDRIKQLYRMGRFEAALLDIDEMIRAYPTDPKLHAMRGTCLERLSKPELAIKAWEQSLRFDPTNLSLKRFIERKVQKRGLAKQ
jgi:hypothetical protein